MAKKADIPADPKAALLSEATAQFGAGALMELGSRPAEAVSVIQTGSTGLDVALGVGGFPRGRIVEIYGPEMSGKTTIALHAIANAQRVGGVAVMIDAEHALDPDYAAAIGVDTDRLLLSQPDTGEQGLEIADMCIRSGVVDIVVVDSVAALVPKAEIEGEMGDSHPGLQARLMSQALRKITGSLSKTHTTCIFINQLREKIGVFYGNPETTTGGKALKFYASVRLDVRKIETLKDGTSVFGHRVRIKVVKNKMAPPFRQWECDLIYGRGISRAAELVDLGVSYGLVKKGGAFYAFPDGNSAQGKDKARAYLDANPALMDSMAAALKDLMMGVVPTVPAAPEPAKVAEPEALIPGSGSLADLLTPAAKENGNG